MKYIYSFLVSSLLIFKSYSQEKVSHYVFPEFVKGKVLMEDGTSYEKLLNYNSLTEEMIFENNLEKLAISSQDLVDTVYISNRKFIRFDNKFLELIHTSSFDLYAERNCKVVELGAEGGYGQRSNNTAVHSVSYYKGNNIYRKLTLPNEIQVKSYMYYWLKKDGKVLKFIKLRQLLKLYPDKKAIFKAFVKKHDVKYGDQGGLVELIKYLERE